MPDQFIVGIGRVGYRQKTAASIHVSFGEGSAGYNIEVVDPDAFRVGEQVVVVATYQGDVDDLWKPDFVASLEAILANIDE